MARINSFDRIHRRLIGLGFGRPVLSIVISADPGGDGIGLAQRRSHALMATVRCESDGKCQAGSSAQRLNETAPVRKRIPNSSLSPPVYRITTTEMLNFIREAGWASRLLTQTLSYVSAFQGTSLF